MIICEWDFGFRLCYCSGKRQVRFPNVCYAHLTYQSLSLLSQHNSTTNATDWFISLLLVSPQHPWIPLLTSEEQPCQPVQLPRSGTGHGLRERLCRRWAQHFWGKRQPQGFPVSATTPGASLQRCQPDQPRSAAGRAPCQWENALHGGLQRCGVAGRGNFRNNLTCRSAAAWGDLMVSCFILLLTVIFSPFNCYLPPLCYCLMAH